ncbi:hypothetical protein CI238_11857 [Colletotrichum incanum]|uniref:Uncharacterized protein n=1 Tax=Colletotrichum incanum TaxID=1573173 RepID=A0A166MHZ1_COLIC|nr:hypothetical protein CI238_11857 [Colletotrichum incanum]OHW89515.1 hypothetical protein CSPAE12_11903 [Colletotrichum incanum]
MAQTGGTISATPSFTKQRKCRAKGSLNDILTKNAGLRLFVKPVQWTNFHLDCLGVSFTERPPCDTPVPPASSQGTYPSYDGELPKSAQDLLDALNNMLGAETEALRTDAICAAMSQLYCGQLTGSKNTDLHHYFGHRAYHNTCRMQVLWKAAPPRSSCITSRGSEPTWSPATSDVPTDAKTGRVIIARSEPILAYVSTGTVQAARRNTYKARRDNAPVERLNKLSYKTFAPLNAHQDPFLAGVTLALAQRPFYHEPRPPAAKSSHSLAVSPSFNDKVHDVAVHILTIDDRDPDVPYFIVHDGVVTEALLRKFHNPVENPQPTGEADGMRIEYTRVPIWPVLGLKERLGKALGKDIVGDFNEDHIEMWGMGAKSSDGRHKRPNDDEVQSSSHDEKFHHWKRRCGRWRRKHTKAMFANESRVM